jgi:hypothetical protein
MAKGQPDFFGQPIQPKPGLPSRIGFVGALVAVGNLINVTYLLKGTFSRLVIKTGNNADLINLSCALYIDGQLVAGGSLYGFIRESYFTDLIPPLRTDYIDVINSNCTFIFDKPLSIETSVRVTVTGAAGVLVAGWIMTATYAQVIL